MAGTPYEGALAEGHSTSECPLAPTARGKDEKVSFESGRASACTDRFNGAGPDFADGHSGFLPRTRQRLVCQRGVGDGPGRL
jgi:hypothetical protein